MRLNFTPTDWELIATACLEFAEREREHAVSEADARIAERLERAADRITKALEESE